MFIVYQEMGKVSSKNKSLILLSFAHMYWSEMLAEENIRENLWERDW